MSTMCPPTCGSNTVFAIGDCMMLCSRGLNSPKFSVNTVNARSWGASTTICLRMAAVAAWIMTSPLLV